MQLEVLVQTMKTTFHTPRWAVLAAQSLGMERMRETAPKEAVGCTIEPGRTQMCKGESQCHTLLSGRKTPATLISTMRTTARVSQLSSSTDRKSTRLNSSHANIS